MVALLLIVLAGYFALFLQSTIGLSGGIEQRLGPVR